jgi:hypothetical protein
MKEVLRLGKERKAKALENQGLVGMEPIAG